MTELEILEQLKKIFTLVINRSTDVNIMTLDAKLTSDLGVSSVGLIYLMVAIEEQFSIDMSDVTFNSFETVGDVVKYIKSKK